MIIIGNKKLRETNKNFRALIIKLHKIIVRKDAEIKELKNILANVQDEIDDALYRELAGMENDLENTYCENVGIRNCIKRYKRMVGNNGNN